MITRLEIENAIEEWRDELNWLGTDQADMLVLYDVNLVKDLAREILVKVRMYN